MRIEPLYKIKLTCSQCEKDYETSRVRPSYKVGISRDTDFCLYFKYPEYNPDYYVIRVCPHCGYATSENFENAWTEKRRQAFQEQFGKRWAKRDYGGKRTWQDALETYQLGLLCAQIVGEKDRIIASLLHHIAWLYRYANNEEQEMRFLKFARDAYIRVYELEGVAVNDARLMYLIGELSRRLKDYGEAIRWFSRVVHDMKIMDSAMIQASREQWAATREDLEREKAKLGDRTERGRSQKIDVDVEESG